MTGRRQATTRTVAIPLTAARRAAVAMVLMLVSGSWLMAGPAAADTNVEDCDTVLVDSAGVLSDAEADEVSDAAMALRSETSFEVRVRILTQEDAPTLEEWVATHERECASWTSADGAGFRSNLVVLAFTTDTVAQSGETWLAYGDQMPDAMDDRWDDIQADTINPALRDGDWVRGITAGLDEIQTTIDPPPSRAWIWLLGIAAAIALIIAIRWWIRRRTYRKHLTEQFHDFTSKVDEQTLELDALLTTLHCDLELVRATFHDSEATTVLGSAEEHVNEGDQLIQQRSELSNHRDTVLSGRDISELAAAVDAWKALRKKADRLVPELRTEETRLTEALTDANGVAERLGRVPETAASVRTAADTAIRQGFAVADDIVVLDTVDERVSEIERLIGERMLIAAGNRVDGLLAELTTAIDGLGALHQRRADLRERLTALRADLAEPTAAEDAAAAYDALSAYASSARADLDGRLEEGRAVEGTAREAFDRAEQALAIGNLKAAELAATEADEARRAAADTYAAITDRLAAVERLSRELPERKSTADSKLSELETLLSNRSAAAKVETGRVGRLRSRLDALDFTVATPDWLALETELSDIESTMQASEREANKAIRAAIARRRRDQERLDQEERLADDRGGSWWSGGSYSRRRRYGSSRSWGGSSRRRSSAFSSGGSTSRRSRGGGGSRGRSGGRRGGGSRR